jgi:3-oxoacyl-[acyl-carrier-protein] synthase II
VPSTHRRVVVTGLGCISPVGNDVVSTWDAMLAGRSGVAEVTRFDTSGMPSRIAAEVKGFDPVAALGRKSVRRSGLFMQYALVAAAEAMADAGYVRGDCWPDPNRFGAYVASGIGGFPEIVGAARSLIDEGTKRISAMFIPRSLINLAAGLVTIELDARGPSLCIATACAAGNHSIGEAWRSILFGDADVMIAGGTEAAIDQLGYGGFMNMRALSKRNDDPTTASRPFDAGRDGFVMGEGAGLIVMETLEHALARGARIYCEVVGYALTTDAHHITAPAPGGEGAARCMRRAMEVAGLEPTDVDYVNAHGTSTPINDPTETAAIRSVFGEQADRLAVSSTKGVTGHLLGAAGGLEAIALAKTLYTGWVPPTANLTTPDPQCDLDYVPGCARKADPRAGLSNGFGFGGTNAVLAMKRWEE